MSSVHYKRRYNWFTLLKNTEYYSEWLENSTIRTVQLVMSNTNPITWKDFIEESFNWDKTPEGFGFWYYISCNPPTFDKKEIYYV